MKKKIEELLKQALDGGRAEVVIPKDGAHGDYSSSVALSMAKQEGKKPREVAEGILKKIEKLPGSDILKKAEIAGPGHLNFFVKDEMLAASLTEICKKQQLYGYSKEEKDKSVLLEFVSANPTGPLHIGHGRWAAIGDSMARILKAAGYRVQTEFYVNNVGRQVELLIQSVLSHMNGTPLPRDGYAGAYVKEIADACRDMEPERLKAGVLEKILKEQKETLSLIDVNFDNWFSEQTLHESGRIKETLETLKKKGLAYEKEGALWFRSTDFGDDKDRVLVRESGDPTYFAADLAYHEDKFKRGFELLINVWGTDHHGYVKRLLSSLEALGHPKGSLRIIIGQLVSLYRGSEPVRMSKRTGDMITLREVIEETGSDATRFSLLMTGADSHMDFDIELAKKKSMDNPVYYVQYAHARICSVFEEAKTEPDFSNLSLLSHASERELIKKLADLPDAIERAAASLEPHHIARYARELAALFHSYYHKCRVITEDAALTKARLALLFCARIVLANVLKLLGSSAPERM